MGSDGLGFRGTVLAGLVVAAIVAVATWLLGFLPQAWGGVVVAARWLGRALAFSVPVPVVVLVIFAGFALYVWRSAVLRKREARAHKVVESKPREATAVESAPLTDNEVSIIRLLAGADGKWMTLFELARRAALANLVTEQAVDRLLERDFLKQTVSMERGRMYCLSRTGRDYAIAEGYVRKPTPAATFRRTL